MKFLPALSTLLLTLSLSTASPIPDLDERACLTQAQATAILQAYTALTEKKGDVSSEANKLLAPNFSFLSDSYSSLLGSALGTPVDRSTYISVASEEAAVKNLKTLSMAHTCNTIFSYWKGTVGSGAKEIRGFALFTDVKGGQIGPSYVEFNSIAWGDDLGGKYSPP